MSNEIEDKWRDWNVLSLKNHTEYAELKKSESLFPCGLDYYIRLVWFRKKDTQPQHLGNTWMLFTQELNKQTKIQSQKNQESIVRTQCWHHKT